MASRTRELRVIAEVLCPFCDAGLGERCRVNPRSLAQTHGRPIVHSERRAAWRAKRDGRELACSLCGYVPPPDADERILRSDLIAGAPLVCDACEEVEEARIELERRTAFRDARKVQRAVVFGGKTRTRVT